MMAMDASATATFYALLAWWACTVAAPLALAVVSGVLLLLVVVRVATVATDAFPASCLYVGRVRHTRLKGGAVHAFEYPIFFSFLDLDEVDRVGWGLWPIFKVNGGWGSFCSLDYSDHLRDWDGGSDGDTVDGENSSSGSSSSSSIDMNKNE
jgi:hypothetical protein